MKIKNKKNYLLRILLSTFLIAWIINITWAKTINTNPDKSNLHRSYLFSLFLGDTKPVEIKVNSWCTNLNILMNGSGSTTNSTNLPFIWGWSGNTISKGKGWIGWWYKNKIEWENWTILWWLGNKIEWKNWTILWWSGNKIKWTNWIILWWSGNTSNNWWIILWWKNNSAWENSLVLWSNSKWWKNSFIWNWNEGIINSAYIHAPKWMLINTTQPTEWISLVVNWAIKLWQTNNNHAWWIFVTNSWCIKYYDWNTVNTLGISSSYDNECWISKWCPFGAVMLHHWDVVTWYKVSYAKQCKDFSNKITCMNWKLIDESNNSNIYIYPYCYNLSSNPIIDVQEWYQYCSWLPKNAEWINPYFKQTKNWNGYYPKYMIGHYSNNPNDNEACSFKCQIWYEYDENKNKCIRDNNYYTCNWWDQPNLNDDNIIYSPIETSENTEWTYIELKPGSSRTKPCQWSCTENYVRNEDSCELKKIMEIIN